jgi:hypothetical protein
MTKVRGNEINPKRHLSCSLRASLFLTQDNVNEASLLQIPRLSDVVGLNAIAETNLYFITLKIFFIRNHYKEVKQVKG